MKITDKDAETFRKVLEADTSNFISLIEIAGLNPKRDLRYSDLSGVDFTDCDLRGCDLSGADLSNSTGQNVLWDETTSLRDADLTNSIFEDEAGSHGRPH